MEMSEGATISEDASPQQNRSGAGQEKPFTKVCLGCRAIKVRCNLPPGALTGSRCTRCIRLNLVCEYRPRAPRTQKKKEGIGKTVLHYAPDEVSHAGPSSTSPGKLSDGMQQASPESAQHYPPVLPSSSTLRPPPHHTHSKPSPPSASPTSSNSPPEGPRLRDNSVLALVEAAEATASKTPAVENGEADRRRLPLYSDPVELHVVTEAEAIQLCDFFHTHLNPCIKLFDPALHTPFFLRRSSKILYTATLTVAAKFLRPELYPRLLAHAQQLVARGITDSVSHIGLVQALVLLVYWKEPSDNTAWMKIGIAIRLGYQLRLHLFRRPLPEDEHEARVTLDRERTWLQLICCDYSYYLYDSHDGQTGQFTASMTTAQGINLPQWLDESLVYGVTNDVELVACAELAPTMKLMRTLETATAPAGVQVLANLIDGMHQTNYMKYLDGDSRYAALIQFNTRFRFYWYASFSSSAKAKYNAGAHDDLALAEYLTRAAGFVATILEMINEGILNYLQDTVATTMFSMAEFFAKIFPNVHANNQALLVQWMTQIYSACMSTKHGNENCVAAFLARFFRNVLRFIAQMASMPPSRAPSPKHGEAEWAGHLSSAFENLEKPLEQELFAGLRPGGDREWGGMTDTPFWESIFPGFTDESWAWLDPGQAPHHQAVHDFH